MARLLHFVIYLVGVAFGGGPAIQDDLDADEVLDPLRASDPELQVQLNTIGFGPRSNGRRGEKRKRNGKPNRKYSAETKAAAAKDGFEMGVSDTCLKWAVILGESLPESTLRNWMKKYKEKSVNGQPVDKIEKEKMGRPLKVPADIDSRVQKQLHAVGEKGGNVCGQTAIETAMALLTSKYPRLASSIQLAKSWSQSLFKRMGYVKRKVTRAARHPPSDPSAVKRQVCQESSR